MAPRFSTSNYGSYILTCHLDPLTILTFISSAILLVALPSVMQLETAKCQLKFYRVQLLQLQRFDWYQDILLSKVVKGRRSSSSKQSRNYSLTCIIPSYSLHINSYKYYLFSSSSSQVTQYISLSFLPSSKLQLISKGSFSQVF